MNGAAGTTADFAALIARFGVAGLLGRHAISKVLALDDFQTAVGGYHLLPPKLVPAASRAIPAAEIILGAFMAVGLWLRETAALTAAMLALYTAAIAINLARGVEFDCGCRGGKNPRPASWGRVLGNLVLITLAWLVAYQAHTVTLIALPGTTVQALLVLGCVTVAVSLVGHMVHLRRAAKTLTGDMR